ncbi:MAG: EAL domain-containing protein [Nitrospirae bacterium]|nr:EAL domain-containing protein [Nitrospirota bacterium]
MRILLKNKIGFLLFLMLVISITNLIVIFYFQTLQKNDSYIINLSGRQRMRTQRITKYAIAIGTGNTNERVRLVKDIERYDSAFKELKDKKNISLRKIYAEDNLYNQIFSKNKLLWETFKENAEIVVKENIDTPSFKNALKFIYDHSDALLSTNDELTNYYEQMSERKNSIMMIALCVMTGLDLMVFIIGIIGINTLINPIKNLYKAAINISKGQYFQKIPIPRFNDEIYDLAIVFNDMSINLYNTIISEEFLNNIINTTPDMLFVFSENRIIRLANISTYQCLGYSQKELIGKSIDILFEEGQGVHLSKSILENGSYNLETDMIIKSGEKVSVLCSFSKMKDKHKGSVEIVCIAKDITEQKSYESDLRKLSAAVEQSLSAIVITDKTGKIEFVNQKFTENTGYTLTEVKGKTPRILKSGVHNEAFYKELWETIIAGKEFRSDICNKKKDGSLVWEFMSISPIKDSKGIITHFIAVKIDDTERKKAEERLKFLALYDALTGLPNRVLFEDRLNQAITYGKRTNQKFGIMFLDLDKFKNINDTLGHNIGDLLLQEVALRLNQCLRESDTVSRMGGDEFQILLSNTGGQADPALVAEKIINSLGKPFLLDGNECFIGVSIGICLFPESGEEVETLLKNADLAMYQVKERGRNSYQFYDPLMDAANMERIRLENDIRGAVENKEFILFYQPQIELKTGKIIGAESLIRWKHKEFGLISPAKFIPVAEEIGMINKIGDWVFEEACTQCKQWYDAGFKDINISVNLSSKQFLQKDFVTKLKDTIEKTSVDANRIDIELTEGGIMNDIEHSINMMNEIKKFGIKISVDDFGTGYSSLLYLKRFPIDILKIDQGFIRNSTTDSSDAVITSTIINMAHSLNFKVIAEGVEIVDQLELLRTFNCDAIQGYIFSKPLTAENFRKLLEDEEGHTLNFADLL